MGTTLEPQALKGCLQTSRPAAFALQVLYGERVAPSETSLERPGMPLGGNEQSEGLNIQKSVPFPLDLFAKGVIVPSQC